MDEDRTLLPGFLPRERDELAVSPCTLEELRKDRDPESLLRVLPIHLGCGHSLRETTVRARQAGLADLSDVALMKRLRKSKAWLRAPCLSLFREPGVAVPGEAGFQVRAFDATTVRETGRTGALWRIHCSVALPALVCDHFRIPHQGQGDRREPPAPPGFGRGLRACRPWLLHGAGHRPCCGLRRPCHGPGGHRQRLGFAVRDGSPFDLGTARSGSPKRRSGRRTSGSEGRQAGPARPRGRRPSNTPDT